MTKKEVLEHLQVYKKDLYYQEKSKVTINRYINIAQQFIDSINHESDVKKDDVLMFKQQLLHRNYKTSTLNNYITCLNKFCATCGIDGVKHIKVQIKSSLEDVLLPIDLQRMLRHSKKLGKDDYTIIIKILAYTGIRIAELQYLTLENVKDNFIPVTNKGKTRKIILRGDLRREILAHYKNKKIKSGHFFINPKTGKMYSHVTIWKNLKKIAGAAKVNKKKVHPHSFRHLFAMQFINEGGSMAELADILGHSQLETTRIYQRTTDKQKKERLERMSYAKEKKGYER